MRRVMLALLVLAVGTAAVLTVLPDDKHGTAYFASVKSIYPEDRVRVLGVDVGAIDAITPEPGRVRVDFHYDADVVLPADVRAAIISPTLVSTRFLQLGPAFTGGPELPDGGVVPIENTASPLEFDDLKAELARLATSLGPDGADRDGALARFLEVSAANADGNGERFNETVRAAAAAVEVLADGREDLFGTVANLQVFVEGLNSVSDDVEEFNALLGDVSGTLDDNGDELGRALAGIDRASLAVDAFLESTAGPLTESVDELESVTGTLASQRDNLATVLHVGPNTLLNFFNIYSPRTGAFTGSVALDNLKTPADLVCSAYAASATADAAAATNSCVTTLGPLLNVLRAQQAPIGVNPFAVPGGGGPAGSPGPAPEPSSESSDLPGLPLVGGG